LRARSAPIRGPVSAVNTCVRNPAETLCRSSRLAGSGDVALGGSVLSVRSGPAAAVFEVSAGRRSKRVPLSSVGGAERLGMGVVGPGIGSPGPAAGG
jgi:hypothetical protein